MRIYVVLNLLGRWNFCNSDDLVVMRGWLETSITVQKFPHALELRRDTIYLYYYSQSLFFQWPYKDDQWKKSFCYCYLSMVLRTKFGHIWRCKSSKLSIKVLIGSGFNESCLRSWVQLPPGPFLPVVQLRYCFELDFGDCRTKPSLDTADDDYCKPLIF